MTFRPKNSHQSVATQNQGLHSRIPRTMPVTRTESMDFSACSLVDPPTHGFSLNSSCSGSLTLSSSNVTGVTSSHYSGPEEDGLFLSIASTTTSYVPSRSSNVLSGPLMPNVGSYDLDLNPYDFLADNVFTTNLSSEANFVSLPYQGQGQTQDFMSAYIDMSMCNPPVMTGWNGVDVSLWAPPTRPDTPPPEDYIEENLPYQFLSSQDIQEDPCIGSQDSNIYEVCDSFRPTPQSTSRRTVVQPRPIRSASERNESSNNQAVPANPRNFDDELADKLKARSHRYYSAKVQDDGHFHCPMKAKTGCNHDPTPQRCIYNKYLDSHLKPYRCKYSDPECDEARFSSNACLFRHERETHGLHNHGVNPFLCKFRDCDRSREGNGFPRRWNQRDHMKRVHDYDEATLEVHNTKGASGGTEPSKRRKGSGAPSSAPMKRSVSSAQSKAQMAGVPMSKYYGRVNQARYSAPRVYASQAQYGAATRRVTVDDVHYSAPATISRISRTSKDAPAYAANYS